MDSFAAEQAGRLTIGDQARTILDPIPQYVLPNTVSFVATEAQFTPKSVETTEEREKLMFRVKLQADPKVLDQYHKSVNGRSRPRLRAHRRSAGPPSCQGGFRTNHPDCRQHRACNAPLRKDVRAERPRPQTSCPCTAELIGSTASASPPCSPSSLACARFTGHCARRQHGG